MRLDFLETGLRYYLYLRVSTGCLICKCVFCCTCLKVAKPRNVVFYSCHCSVNTRDQKKDRLLDFKTGNEEWHQDCSHHRLSWRLRQGICRKTPVFRLVPYCLIMYNVHNKEVCDYITIDLWVVFKKKITTL